MYTFEIIEKNENELESIIEMGGVTTKFTVQQILDHIEYTKKVQRESVGQLMANDTQDKMTLEIVPMIKELPQDKWQLIMSYAARQVSRPEIEALIETSKKTLADYDARLQEIKESVGIDTTKPEITTTQESLDKIDG